MTTAATLCRAALAAALGAVAAGCGGGATPPVHAAAVDGSATADGAAADGAGGDSGASVDGSWPPAIDPAAFGTGDLSGITVAAFSQTGVSGDDPQVTTLQADIVPRAWAQWDTDGLRSSDYGVAYPKACQAEKIRFIGGLTASVIFVDEMSTANFADEVGRDATDTPVPHDEIVPGAYRGALASPGFRQLLVGVAETQIDLGVDGLFFDEVNSSYVGANYDGDEGFDDHDVADFGRFLCAKHGGDPTALAAFDLQPSDALDCTAADPGAAFDYRGYLARHMAQAAPLGALNPLHAEWGTTVQNRPNPSAATFVETYPVLVYWQDIVVAVRTYARQKYGKEILVTANGVFPFVDFQSVGLYDWNQDGPGPRGVDYVPVTGTAPDVHYDGTFSFLPVLTSLKNRSNALQGFVGGRDVPLLLFLDWPTDSINRYYALAVGERQDYVRVMLAEAYAVGERFALPLATTTDTNTATALGMMDFFASARAFYEAHADLVNGAQDSAAAVTVSAAGIASHPTTLADGRTVVHLVNHNYAAGFVPQTSVTLTLALPQAPTSVTIASFDAPADAPATFSYAAGTVSVDVGTVTSSSIVVIR